MNAQKKLQIALGSVLALGSASAFAVAATEDCFETFEAGSVTWEDGALDKAGTVPTTYTDEVRVCNNIGERPGKMGFERANNTVIGRTNGAGDDGIGEAAFTFKSGGNPAWQLTVPFAFGYKGSQDALWTPRFQGGGGTQVLYLGRFVADGAKGDEDPNLGSIEIGDFRVVDGDAGLYGIARPGKVVFQKFNGTSWQQIGRTNGPGDDGEPLAFTVITVRKGFTLDGEEKIVNDTATIPVLMIDQISGVNITLRTVIPGTNIGTQLMFDIPAGLE